MPTLVVSKAALTKGFIEVKASGWEKAVRLSTRFDESDCSILASNSAAPLQVQLDLEKARTTETDIEILNGIWADLYRFLGIASLAYYEVAWAPPYSPYARFVNVQQTPGPNLEEKENAFAACYPSPTQGLPHQASAIWKYDPTQGGKLTPTYLASNGTRLPAALHGMSREDNVVFGVYGHGRPPIDGNQILELSFIPVAE
ncbi:hypothetical protein BKA70DRAFT_1463855 [Coprinopsis sp. MPI-PUGE-AT-0042]|nr:hypothetical protein BKA70DRAFT_1463855 [Coprinopsis sp. MPI-PUGE-AT-0042]